MSSSPPGIRADLPHTTHGLPAARACVPPVRLTPRRDAVVTKVMAARNRRVPRPRGFTPALRAQLYIGTPLGNPLGTLPRG